MKNIASNIKENSLRGECRSNIWRYNDNHRYWPKEMLDTPWLSDHRYPLPILMGPAIRMMQQIGIESMVERSDVTIKYVEPIGR